MAGIAEELIGEIDRGDPSYPHELAIGFTLMAVSMIVLVGALAAELAHASLAVVLPLLGLGVLLVLGYSWILVVRRMFVRGLEPRTDGQRSRADLWGGKLRRFGAWALTLIIGAILGAIIQRLLK